jgi:hypothetical protein
MGPELSHTKNLYFTRECPRVAVGTTYNANYSYKYISLGQSDIIRVAKLMFDNDKQPSILVTQYILPILHLLMNFQYFPKKKSVVLLVSVIYSTKFLAG